MQVKHKLLVAVQYDNVYHGYGTSMLLGMFLS